MKILHLIAPVSFGGGESLLYNLLKDSPIQESIALIYNSKEFTKKLDNAKINYYILNKKDIGHFQSRIKYLLDLVINIFLFFRIIKILKNQYTHLHTHGFPSVIFGYIIKIFMPKIKIIYTHHSYRKKPKLYLEYIIFKRIYLKFDKITAVSNSVKKSLVKAFTLEDGIEVIYN